MAATEAAMTDMATKFVMAANMENAGSDVVNMGCTKTLSILAFADSKKRQATVWKRAAVICLQLSDEASNPTGGLYARWRLDGVLIVTTTLQAKEIGESFCSLFHY